MDRPDPFVGYSFILRTIVYVIIPAFGVWQTVRLRRALHVFQLEGYKRDRFLQWCRAHRDRALFLRKSTAKKPLVMTGRAWRLLVVAVILSLAAIVGASGAAHLAGGAPYDILTWALVSALVFWGCPRVLVVADALLTPVQAAINGRYLRRARRKLAAIDPLVVGVAGSFGKTSTKFAIEGLLDLESAGLALATPGSFNTPLGVCRSINENLAPAHRYFVVEIGAYKEGEIAELCRFVEPRIGVLTAIGPAHLERFGSMEVIRRAKYEIVTSLPSDGIAVMNVDDPEVRTLADSTSGVEVVRYGIDPSGAPDVLATNMTTTTRGTTLTIADRRSGTELSTRTRLLGRYSVGHVLAGVAVAVAAGRKLEELGASIAALEPVEHRLHVIEGAGGVTVIDDAFNSNPEGAAAALDVLESMPGDRKVVVTPGIIELGAVQFEANERFGQRAASVADALIVVAKVNRDAILAGARRANRAEVIAVDSLEEATKRLSGLVGRGDVVLFENDLPDQYES